MIAGINTSMSFQEWLKQRDPARWRLAKDYARQYTDPVVLRRVQRSMEAEEGWLRKQLGMPQERRSKKRRGL